MINETTEAGQKRARDFSIAFDGRPGPLNAITDIAGIHVGFSTIQEEVPRPGRKLPVRTDLTAILPHATASEPVPVLPASMFQWKWRDDRLALDRGRRVLCRPRPDYQHP